MNRRKFLLSGVAAAAAALASNRIDRSRISVITDETARSPEAAIAFIKQYRLQWAELRGVPGGKKQRYAQLPAAQVKQAARQFTDNGIRVSFLNASLLKYTLPGTEPVNSKSRRPDTGEKYKQHLDSLRNAIEAAQILGVDKVRVFTFRRVKDPAGLLSRIADIIGEMVEIATREKIHLLVENEASTNVATCAELVALMKLLPSPWLGINWDPLNGTRYHEPPYPDGYAKLPKQRIANVQIKGKSILPGYDEKLDWAAIFAALSRDGYQGQCGLETHIFGDGQIQASRDSMKAILRIVEPS